MAAWIRSVLIAVPMLVLLDASVVYGQDGDRSQVDSFFAAFCQRYKKGGDLDRISELYESFSPSQRQVIQQYLETTFNLQIHFDVAGVERSGDAFVVRYTRRDRGEKCASFCSRFFDEKVCALLGERKEPFCVKVDCTSKLVRTDGTLKLASGGENCEPAPCEARERLAALGALFASLAHRPAGDRRPASRSFCPPALVSHRSLEEQVLCGD